MDISKSKNIQELERRYGQKIEIIDPPKKTRNSPETYEAEATLTISGKEVGLSLLCNTQTMTDFEIIVVGYDDHFFSSDSHEQMVKVLDGISANRIKRGKTLFGRPYIRVLDEKGKPILSSD